MLSRQNRLSPPRAGRVATCVLFVVIATLFVLLWDEVTFSGTNTNDLVAHTAYASALRNEWARGELGLDTWFDLASLGAPVFRWYQHVPHLIVAALARGVPSIPIAQWIHILLIAALLAQIPAFAYCARRLGLSDAGVALAGILALGPVSLWGNGNELSAYLFVGHGLFTQALAVPCLLLGLASTADACRLTERNGARPNAVAAGLRTGLWMALCFHFHPMYAYFLVLFCGVLALPGLLHERETRRAIVIHFAVAGGVSALACSYQLRTLWQESVFFHRTFWDYDQVWTGHGFRSVLKELVAGRLLDGGRLPVLTVLLGAGAGVTAVFHRTRPVTALWGCFALSIVLLAGSAGWPVLERLPGIRALHLERSTGLLHVFSVLLCAAAGEAAIRLTAAPRRSLRRAGWLLTLGASAGVCYVIGERGVELLRNGAVIREQRSADARLDARLIDEVRRASIAGPVWAGAKDSRYRTMRVGLARLDQVFLQAGIPQLIFSHTLGYTADMVPFFDPAKPASHSVFNVAALVLDRRVGSVKGGTTVYEGPVHSIYATAAPGPLDVVRISAVERIEDDLTRLRAERRWVGGELPNRRSYPALIPATLAARLPQAIPIPSPREARGGEVVDWQRRENGGYEAVLRARSAGNYGILRTAYHPRWRVTVNGRPRVPRWVSPGFLAFPIGEGVNRVTLEFPVDRVRERWFWFSFAVLSATAVIVGGGAAAARVRRYRLRRQRAWGLSA